MPSVLEALGQLGASSMAKLVKEMDKGEKWIRAGLKEARKQTPPLVKVEGKARQTRYRLAEDEPDQGELVS